MLHVYISLNDRLAESGDQASLDAPGIVWLDLLDPSAEEVARVEAHLGIDIPTRDEMAEIELSDRLYREDGAEFMTMTAVANSEGEEPVKSPVTFIVKDSTLVTVRHADPRPFMTYAAVARRSGALPCASGEMVMLGLIEAVIDRMADVLERCSDNVDAISREVFRNKSTNATRKTRDLTSLIERIGRVGDLLTKVQESLVSMARLVAFHGAIDPAEPQTKATRSGRQRLKLVQRDASSLREHAIFLSGKTGFLLDATLGLVNLEQNQIIKIFSVAAVVLLPPTLVASVYGMNFDFMPELRWPYGYPFAIGLMIVSAVLPFLYFKRRGWL